MQKYQGDIIHDIEMTCECVVFLHKRYTFIHDLAPCNSSKNSRAFLECYGILVLKWPGISPDMNSIDRVGYMVKKRNW